MFIPLCANTESHGDSNEKVVFQPHGEAAQAPSAHRAGGGALCRCFHNREAYNVA